MTDLTFDDLNEDQQIAFNAVVEAIDKKTNLTINGPAGTGKTTLTKFIINHLVKNGVNGVMLAAPTHQAKKVLSNLSGFEANTIHSLLKISPSTYEDEATFSQSDVPDLSECRVLICDEVSMYDRELFKILMASVPINCSIIGLGDIAQIRPVAPNSNIPELSAFFFNEKFKQVSLTKVMRSNAPIIDVATDIRNGKWIYEKVVDGSGVHSMLLKNGKSVANFLNKFFEIVKTPDDLFENRMFAFTNKSIDNLNKIIRKRLYNTDEPFIVGEVIVMQEPLVRTHQFEGKKFTEVMLNNGELVRITNCFEKSVTLSLRGFSELEAIKVWHLDVTSIDSGNIEFLQVIVDEGEQNKFQGFMGKSATEFKSGGKGTSRPNWKGWWELKGKFSKVKALPCSTIHKSQGSTVTNAFVYTPCIHKCDGELAQQLLYVATTRAKENVYFV